MSAADFSTDPAQLVYIAQYLSRIGLDHRALSLYQQVVKIDSMRHEAYLLGLRTAQRIEDRAGLEWATLGILGRAWPQEQSSVPQTAMRVAKSILDQLQHDGNSTARQAYEQKLRDALVRDCIVRVTWTGDADVDLFVEEPGGTICSLSEPRTTSGGLMMGDAFANNQQKTADGFAETYICPHGFSGVYRARIRRVWGDVTAGKVTVDVYTHYGSDQVQHQREQLELTDGDAVVVFDLQPGRRTDSLEATQIAGAVRRQQQIGHAVLAQQIDDVSQPSIIPGRPGFELDRRRRLALGGGAVGFQPQITVLPDGTQFVAQAVISPDRKYVRVTALPMFNTIGDVTTFTFAGAAEEVEADDGGDAGAAAP
jgi:hypothetical protein